MSLCELHVRLPSVVDQNLVDGHGWLQLFVLYVDVSSPHHLPMIHLIWIHHAIVGVGGPRAH
jgi:hypothetical protein